MNKRNKEMRKCISVLYRQFQTYINNNTKDLGIDASEYIFLMKMYGNNNMSQEELSRSLIVDNLDYLKKGGGLSASKAAIGSMLSITKEHIKNNIEDKRIGIAHGDNEVEFKKLKEAINSELSFTKTTEAKIGSSIGSHTVAGTIGLCIWNK